MCDSLAPQHGIGDIAPVQGANKPGNCDKFAVANHNKGDTMRFMILINADQDTEAGKMPSEQLLRDMGNFNQQLVDAGIMLAGEGLHPTAKGAKVHFEHGKVEVTEGPFALADHPLAGFWIWRCDSREEAIDWVKKVPMPMQSGKATLEIRQIFEAEDFGAEFTPELRDQEHRMRAELAGHQGR